MVLMIKAQEVRGKGESTKCILVGYSITCWPGSSVDIVTAYGLDGPGIESR